MGSRSSWSNLDASAPLHLIPPPPNPTRNPQLKRNTNWSATSSDVASSRSASIVESYGPPPPPPPHRTFLVVWLARSWLSDSRLSVVWLAPFCCLTRASVLPDSCCLTRSPDVWHGLRPLNLLRNMMTKCQIQIANSLTNERFEAFKTWSLPRKRALAAPLTSSHACQRFNSPHEVTTPASNTDKEMFDVLRQKPSSDPPKAPNLLRLPRKTYIVPKTGRAGENAFPITPFWCETPSENGRSMSFLRCKGHTNNGEHVCNHLRSTRPWPLITVRTP